MPPPIPTPRDPAGLLPVPVVVPPAGGVDPVELPLLLPVPAVPRCGASSAMARMICRTGSAASAMPLSRNSPGSNAPRGPSNGSAPLKPRTSIG